MSGLLLRNIGRQANTATSNPKTIAEDLMLWTKDDAYTDLAGTDVAENNDPVRLLKDQSGNSNDLAYSAVADMPQYKTGYVNTADALLFQLTQDRGIWRAKNDSLAFNFQPTSPFSLFLVAKPIFVSYPGMQACLGRVEDNPNFVGWLLFQQSNRNDLRFWVARSLTSHIAVNSSKTLSNNTPFRLIVVYDGSSTAAGVQMWFDGVKDTSLVTVRDDLNGAISSNGDLVLGDIYVSGASQSRTFHGGISDAGIYGRALNDLQIVALDQYLKNANGF